MSRPDLQLEPASRTDTSWSSPFLCLFSLFFTLFASHHCCRYTSSELSCTSSTSQHVFLMALTRTTEIVPRRGALVSGCASVRVAGAPSFVLCAPTPSRHRRWLSLPSLHTAALTLLFVCVNVCRARTPECHHVPTMQTERQVSACVRYSSYRESWGWCTLLLPCSQPPPPAHWHQARGRRTRLFLEGEEACAAVVMRCNDTQRKCPTAPGVSSG